MTIATTLAALKTALAALPAPTTPIAVYADPLELTSLGDFPVILLALAPQVDHRWSTEAMAGLARHDYTVSIFIFLGQRNTPLAELHTRILPWPQALMTKFAGNITLSGAVDQLGDGRTPELLTYRYGPISWAGGEYWGIRCLLPIVEKPTMTMA